MVESGGWKPSWVMGGHGGLWSALSFLPSAGGCSGRPHIILRPIKGCFPLSQGTLRQSLAVRQLHISSEGQQPSLSSAVFIELGRLCTSRYAAQRSGVV